MDLNRALVSIEHKEVIKEINWLLEDVERSRINEDEFWSKREEELRKYNIADPLSSPLEKLIPNLPFPLAVVVSEYLKEQHPYIKLHRLCDAAEMFTRFSAVVSLISVYQSDEGFPKALQNVLLDSIKRPSFGSWLNILRQTIEQCGNNDELLSRLHAYFKNHLEPSLQASGTGAPKEDAIVEMRNHLAHAGRLPDGEAEGLLLSHKDRFEQEVVQAADFWSECKLVVCGNDGCFLANGLPMDGDFTEYHDSSLALDAGHAALIYKDGVILDLYPLHAFLEVVQARDEVDAKLGIIAPQLYCRMSDAPVVEFTVLHDAYSFAQQRDAIVEAWQQMFPLQTWQQAAAFKKGKKLWQQRFLSLHANLSDVFVGREDEIKKLKELIKTKEHRLLWVTGKPGMGKSALMARMISVMANWDAFVVIPYYFRTGHSYCSSDDFLKASFDYFGEILNERISVPDPSEMRKVFIESLKKVIEVNGNKRLVFVLDGIDEIERIKPGEMLKVLTMARSIDGVTWLCAGRPEDSIVEMMNGLEAHFIFGEEGLNKLSSKAVRAILNFDLGAKKYDLFEKDRNENGDCTNPWIDTIVQRSEGLPIYIRLLTEDIARGNRQLEDVDKLPEGLTAYYEETLARLKVSSVGAALTTIFCLLSQAREPLDEALLYGFLSDFKANLHKDDPVAWDRGIKKALDQGSMMMVRESTPEGKPGWQLYHESFNDLLMASPSVKEDRQEAMLCIRKQCAHWSDNKVIQSYSLRHFFYHLRQANKSEDIFALMRDDHFIEMQQQQDIELPMSALLETLQVAHSDKNWICMAEFSLQRGKLIDALRHESPWDAIRRGTLQRALDLADLYDVKGRSESLLLCAWELLGQSKGEQAKEVLQHLFEKEKYTLGGILLPAEIILANFILVCGVDSLYLNHWGDAVHSRQVKILLPL